MTKKWFNTKLPNSIYNKEWKAKAKKQRMEIFRFLNSLDFVNRKFTSGSFGRKTNLPTSDIDIFVEIKKYYFQEDIHEAQEKLYGELQRKWPDNSIRPQEHTIGVVLKDVKFELVPAIQINEQQYLIPEGEKKIITEPHTVKDNVKKMNGKTYGMFSHFTRIIKFWKKQHDVPLPSFYLELLILEEMKNGWRIKSDPLSFAAFFCEIVQKVKARKYPELFSGKLSSKNKDVSNLNRILDTSMDLLKDYKEQKKNKLLKQFFAF
ncbi:MAG: nucleotidyltransferase [Methanobacteriota archaeon]|nr:MAG: nucleotidyltransferase [Euryarchaeota archaeon]